MAEVEEYRRFALECARLSREATDPYARSLFLAMARNWMLLAEQAIKNVSGAYRPESSPADDPDSHSKNR